MLSKSRLLSFRQCPLRLWNEIHRRELAKTPDAAAQHIFDEGTRIGQLARQRYPGGRLIEADKEYSDEWIPAYAGMTKSEIALRQTLDSLNNPSLHAIYEAAFLADQTFIRADILKRIGPNEWEMWEVKSVVNPKEIHEVDVAIQVEVVRRWAKASQPAGRGQKTRIVCCGVLHLNRDYVYPGGDYDLDQLFTEYDCTGMIDNYRDEVDCLIHDGLATAALADPPDISPGDQCSDPYDCPFSGTACGLPEVEELSLLPRMSEKKIAELKARGFERIADLSETESYPYPNSASRSDGMEEQRSGH